MENNILQGLSISLTGILITFCALGVFILVIFILQRVFSADQGQISPALGNGKPSEAGGNHDTGEDPEQEIVAAIAAALMQLRARQQSNTGKALETGPGQWWVVGQVGQHSSRPDQFWGRK